MNVNFRNTSRTRKREHDKEGEQEVLIHIQVSKMYKINIYQHKQISCTVH